MEEAGIIFFLLFIVFMLFALKGYYHNPANYKKLDFNKKNGNFVFNNKL